MNKILVVVAVIAIALVNLLIWAPDMRPAQADYHPEEEIPLAA